MIGPSSSRSRFNSSGRPPPRPTSEPALPDRDPSGEQESPAADSKAESRSVRKTAGWIGPDEGFLGLHRRSLDLRSFPDPSRLAPPDLFAPAPASSEETGGDDPDIQVREAPGPEVRKRRRAGLPARAVAAHPTAAESTSAQPASPEPAAPEPAAAEVMQTASVSIQEDGSRVIAAEPTRSMLALAHRIGAQDLRALRELAPSGLAPPALVERFACFRQSVNSLGWHDIGRLMFAFVQAWQSRLTDPSWPLAWWALNSEVSRRDPDVSDRVQACFAAAYVFARGICSVDRQLGASRAAQEVLVSLAARDGTRTSQKWATFPGRCLSYAIACLDPVRVAPCTDRTQSLLLQCFSATTSVFWAVQDSVAQAPRGEPDTAPPPTAAAMSPEQAVAGLPRLGRPTLAVHVDPSAGDGHRSQAR